MSFRRVQGASRTRGRVDPAGAFCIAGLEPALILRVDERLADERDGTEQRDRIAIASRRLKLHVQRDGRLHDAHATARRSNRADDRRLCRGDDVHERAVSA